MKKKFEFSFVCGFVTVIKAHRNKQNYSIDAVYYSGDEPAKPIRNYKP